MYLEGNLYIMIAEGLVGPLLPCISAGLKGKVGKIHSVGLCRHKKVEREREREGERKERERNKKKKKENFYFFPRPLETQRGKLIAEFCTKVESCYKSCFVHY